MHDLRRQALESGKTTSRKAASRQSSGRVSRTASQPTSSPGSRNHSRAPSDDEEGGIFSDDTATSINSIDEFLASDDFNEATPDDLKDQLSERIDELIARKGSTNKGREECLGTYIRILSSHLLADVLYGRITEIIGAITKSIKSEISERETVFALRALAVTAITMPNLDLYAQVSSLLKRTISDSQSTKAKSTAIYCLGDCLSYGGAGEDEILDQMTFLLEVISSDGNFIDAADDVDTVVAALHVYAFLSSQVGDVEAESEDAIEALLEQLDSSSPEVQVAAGECIALFYEKASRHQVQSDSDSDSEDDGDEASEEDDEEGNSNISDEPSEKSSQNTKKSPFRYQPYHNTHAVLSKVSYLSTYSSKKVNRKSKKNLHQAFTAILHTVEDPRGGFRLNNRAHMTIRIYSEGEMSINKWWKMIRLSSLRRLLGGGFINHYYEGNKAVLDILPVLISRRTGGFGSGSDSGKKGKRYKDQSYSPRSLALLQEF